MLFSTYTTLVGPGTKSRTRLQQIIDWCGGEQFDGCLRAVRALLQPNGAAAAPPPPPPAEGEGEGEGGAVALTPEAEADAALPEESLPLLHQLFDPLQGAAAADSALCSWLLALLHPS